MFINDSNTLCEHHRHLPMSSLLPSVTASIVVILVLLANLCVAMSPSHFCDCIQSTSLLSSCLRMQALSRSERRVRLIESDLLIEFSDGRIDLLSPKPMMKMFTFKTKTPKPRFGAPWTEYFSRTNYKQLATRGTLKYYSFYPQAYLKYPNGRTVSTKIGWEHFILERGESIFEDGTEYTVDIKRNFYVPENTEFTTIVSNMNSEGYLVQMSKSDSMLKFYNLDQLLTKKLDQIPAYLLTKISPDKAKFVMFTKRMDSSKISSLISSQPYGLILKNQVLLLDFKTEQAFIFLKDILDYEKPFSFKQVSIRDFILCTPPNTLNGSSTPSFSSSNDAVPWPVIVGAIVVLSVVISLSILFLIFARTKQYDIQNVNARIGGDINSDTHRFNRKYNYYDTGSKGRRGDKTKHHSKKDRRRSSRRYHRSTSASTTLSRNHNRRK